MRGVWGVRPCPRIFSRGSKGARLHEEIRVSKLLLQAR
jgi:hypothetical protein